MGELFNTFGIDWRLLIIQAVNFGLLITALTYFLYRPVLNVLEERRKKIEGGVAAAKEAEEKLAAITSERDEVIGKASQEAEGIIANAKTRAETAGSELTKAAQTRADSILADAAARAEEAQRRAMEESRKEIARAAVLAAEKILRERNA